MGFRDYPCSIYFTSVEVHLLRSFFFFYHIIICYNLWFLKLETEDNLKSLNELVVYLMNHRIPHPDICFNIERVWILAFCLRLPLQIENSYRIKKEILEKTKTAATPKQKHVGPRQLPNNAYLGDTAEEAAITAAYKVAEAENKSFVAAEAAKEAERVSKMEEDSDNSLQIYKDIFDKCMFLPYSSCLNVLYFKFWLVRQLFISSFSCINRFTWGDCAANGMIWSFPYFVKSEPAVQHLYSSTCFSLYQLVICSLLSVYVPGIMSYAQILASYYVVFNVTKK